MVISHLGKGVPGIVVGAGSVTKPDDAQKCLDAGAQFLTSDGFHPAIVEFGAKHSVGGLDPQSALTPRRRSSAPEKQIRISSRSFPARNSGARNTSHRSTSCFRTFR